MTSRLRRILQKTRHLFAPTPKARKWRYEKFGAIIQLRYPRSLLFVDKDFAQSAGIPSSNTWVEEKIGTSPLTAPLEAHLQITNRCDLGCKGCYTAASPQSKNEWSLGQWKKTVDHLAEMGVFHLALGGGESADLPWLEDLVHYARQRGLVPNLTTSGLSNLSRIVKIAHLFGQINISLDGLGDTYEKVRGFDGFNQADKAIVQLRRKLPNLGINVVVTKHNFNELPEIFAYAKSRRLNEIELLRFKPSGRGVQTFSEMTCSDAQHREFLPLILQESQKKRIRVRVDCSYMPMLAHHAPSKELLGKLAVYGCTGGDFLVAAKANGQLSACSFAAAPSAKPSIDALAEYWDSPEAFGEFRTWQETEAPCASCHYHSLCRGGCKVVSRHLTGSLAKPDPECPRVVDFNKSWLPSSSQEIASGAKASNKKLVSKKLVSKKLPLLS